MAPDAPEPSLVSPTVVDRIVRAIERGDSAGLNLGHDQAFRRLNKLPPPQFYPDDEAIQLQHRQVEQLIGLLAIAVGLYDGSLTRIPLYPKNPSPLDIQAVDRVVAARLKALGR